MFSLQMPHLLQKDVDLARALQEGILWLRIAAKSSGQGGDLLCAEWRAHTMTNIANQGLQSLLRMLRSDPANASLRSKCVNTAIALAEYRQAQQLIDSRLRESPYDPHALFDNASLLIAQKDYRNAILRLNALLANGHRHSGILINLGLCYHCVADFQNARAPLEEAYQAGDRSPGLIRLLVSTLHHLGSVDEAVAVADENTDPARSDGALAGVFALLYLDADRPMPAARWAKTALKFNPDSVDGLVVVGTLQITQMRTAEAERQFKHALRLSPEAGRAWLGLGTLALLARDFPKAKQLVEKSLQSMGGHVGTWHMLAWTQLAAGDLASAENAFQHALELNRNFAETHGGLATLAAMRGNAGGAETLIEVAERLDPACLSAKFARAVLMGNAGDPATAQRIVTETVAGLAMRDSSALSRAIGSIKKPQQGA